MILKLRDGVIKYLDVTKGGDGPEEARVVDQKIVRQDFREFRSPPSILAPGLAAIAMSGDVRIS